MGGTFDPLHLGHLKAAAAARAAFHLDRVLFVPTGRPWQKKRYSDGEDRFLMTMLGAAGGGFGVSRLELDRQGPTYTADTLRELKAFYGEDASFFLILGADAVLGLGTWARVEELAKDCEVVAVTRPGSDLEGLVTEEGWPRVHRLEMEGVDISASDIRSRVRRSQPFTRLVPGPVGRYIESRRLYMEEADA